MPSLKFALFFLTLTLCATKLYAQEPDFQATYANAQTAYYQKNYAVALENLQTLLKENPDNGYVLYNIGNTYFQMGQLAEARQYYAKAKRVLPRFDPLQKNETLLLKELSLAESDTFLKSVTHTFFFINPWVTIGELQLLCFGMTSLFVFFLFWRWRKKLKLFSLGFSILICFYLYFAAGAFVKMSEAAPGRYAIVLKDQVALKSSYLDQSLPILTLPIGLQVKIIDEQIFDDKSRWYRIELPSQETGWVLQDDFGTI